MSEGRSVRIGYAAIAGLLVVAPFLGVTFPPLTDLPQNVAQVRLLAEALQQPDSGYLIQWWTPYTLSTALLSGLWLILPPLAVGRVGFALVGLLWVLATAVLAARRERSPALPLLAALLYFGTSLYWGFLPFLLGLPVFLLWYGLTTTRPDRFAWTDLPLQLGVALLLYTTHALWFALGLLWLGLRFALGRGSRRVTLLRGLAVLPVVAAAAAWYPSLARGGFDSGTFWVPGPLARLSPVWISEQLLAGLDGPAPLVVTLVLLVLLVAAGVRARREGGLDGDALLAAALFLVLVLLAPSKFQNTIVFAARWMAPAALFLAIGLPAPQLLRRGRGPALAALTTAYVLATTFAWLQVDRDEFGGLAEALQATPAESRILELDLAAKSEVLTTRPFMQVMAYAQVLHGAHLAFSFAEFPQMPVTFAKRRRKPWTPGLEWYPGRIRQSDLCFFDHLLLHAAPEVLEAVEQELRLQPRSGGAPWRLYQVQPPASCPPAAGSNPG